MNISNNILKTELINWRKAKWLQGEFKTIQPGNLAKLKESLKRNKFIAPFNVWEGGADLWILDGHFRQQAMQELEAEGNKIPEKLPANFIQCKNMRQAKTLILVYSSMYAKASDESLAALLMEANIEPSEVRPFIDLPFIDFDTPGKPENSVITTEQLKAYKKTHILISVHPDKFHEIEKHLEAIKAVKGVEFEQSAN